MNDLKIIDGQPKYDASCKRLFANKIILAHILKGCVPEFEDCELEDIKNKYIEGVPSISDVPVMPDETNNEKIIGMSNEDTAITEQTIRYDIRFSAFAPADNGITALIINLESQNKYNDGYPLMKRAIYYCSRMISSQLLVNSKYGSLKKVYSIWICSNPPTDKANTITRYNITEKQLVGNNREDPANYDLLSVVIINLDRRQKYTQNQDKLLDLLSLLLSDESSETKTSILETRFGIKDEEINGEVNEMCNLSEGILKDGIEIGAVKANVKRIIALMKKQNVSAKEAMDILDVPAEEQDELLKAINDSKNN